MPANENNNRVQGTLLQREPDVNGYARNQQRHHALRKGLFQLQTVFTLLQPQPLNAKNYLLILVQGARQHVVLRTRAYWVMQKCWHGC